MNDTDAADLRRSVREALAEDVGRGDLTAALIPHDSEAKASIIIREQGDSVWHGLGRRDVSTARPDNLGDLAQH